MSPLGYTCEADDENDGRNPHLMEDQYVVEALSPDTWEPVADGTPGTLVVSNLFSESLPILRYAMGDWITLLRTPCACGRTHARAEGGLRGRNDDVVKIKGLKFYPATVEDAVRSMTEAGDEFRVEISAPEGLDRVRIVIEEGPLGPGDPRALGKRVSGLLGIEVTVELVPAGTLPAVTAKAKRFFDLRTSHLGNA